MTATFPSDAPVATPGRRVLHAFTVLAIGCLSAIAPLAVAVVVSMCSIAGGLCTDAELSASGLGVTLSAVTVVVAVVLAVLAGRAARPLATGAAVLQVAVCGAAWAISTSVAATGSVWVLPLILCAALPVPLVVRSGLVSRRA